MDEARDKARLNKVRGNRARGKVARSLFASGFSWSIAGELRRTNLGLHGEVVGILLTPSLATSGAAHLKPTRDLHGPRPRPGPRSDLGKRSRPDCPVGKIMLVHPYREHHQAWAACGADNTFAAAVNILLSRMNWRQKEQSGSAATDKGFRRRGQALWCVDCGRHRLEALLRERE